ncbi:hypothetical protein [Nostoc sp. CCY 9925]
MSKAYLVGLAIAYLNIRINYVMSFWMPTYLSKGEFKRSLD